MKELSRFEKIVIYTLVAVLIAALALLGINIALRSVSKSAGADGEEEETGMYISNAVSTEAVEITVQEIPAAAEEVQPVIEEISAEEIAAEPAEEVPAEEVPAEPAEEIPAEEITEEPVEEIPTEEITEEPAEEIPTEEITEEPAEEIPAEEIAEEPVEEIPDEEITEEPAEEIPAEEIAAEPVEEIPAEEITAEPAEATTEVIPAEEITAEPAEATTEAIPAEEITVVPDEGTTEEIPAEEVLIDTDGMREVQLIAFKGETTVLVYKAPDEDAEVLDWFDSGIWVYLEDHDDEWSTVILDNVRCYVKNGNVLFNGVENITEEEQKIFRSVYITHDLGENKQITAGTPVTFTAHLNGFEGEAYTVQWSYSEDGVNFIDIEGATDLTYTVALSRKNIKYTWHVEVTIVENETVTENETNEEI